MTSICQVINPLHRHNQDIGYFHDSVDMKSVEHFQDSTTLKLSAGAHYLAKEDEEKPLGEDAHFISDDGKTIGVADGVGGYAEFGIDSGVYARELMSHSAEFVNTHSSNSTDPMSILKHAFENSKADGGSTATIITLKDDNTLQAVNIGDSGFLVIRSGKIVYKSPVQQSYFNCPFQLKAVAGRRTVKDDAVEITVAVERGDVVVAATDGLFDNLFEDEIERTVGMCLEEGDQAEAVALKLVTKARRMSLLERTPSPYTVAAIQAGLDMEEHMGGKYDDITVVVGYVN